MIYVGIDPGKTGGIAVIEPDEVRVYETPMIGKEYAEQAMSALVPARTGTRAAIEKQQAFPKQGGVSNFTTGMGYGLWRGILASLMVPYDIVAPRDWRRALGLPDGADKAASVALAARLFPDIAEQLYGPKGGIKDGLAEALLLAEYRRRVG